MGKLILITGGARGGKSTFAEEQAKALPAPRAYLATAPVVDDEMRERIRRHRERRGADFFTIEEETDLGKALLRAKEQGAKTVLIDCLSCFVSNRMYHAEKEGRTYTEDDAAADAASLAAAVRHLDLTVFCVLNEVGLGIIPDNAASRRFRDCSGRLGQVLAGVADEVYFCLLGLVRRLK